MSDSETLAKRPLRADGRDEERTGTNRACAMNSTEAGWTFAAAATPPCQALQPGVKIGVDGARAPESNRSCTRRPKQNKAGRPTRSR